MTYRAHYDGKVFVPEQPVDLPVNTVVEFEARPVPSDAGSPAAFAALIREFVESQPELTDRGGLPTDGATNYRHYLYGHPKAD